MHALSQRDPRVTAVVPLRDKFNADAEDLEWIPALAKEGDWIIISADHFKKSDEEREALRQSGLLVFVLDRQWVTHDYWMQAWSLVRWWPAIVDQSDRITGGGAFRVPWRYRHGGRFEVIRI